MPALKPWPSCVHPEAAAQAYEDMAIVTKRDADGLPVSASTRASLLGLADPEVGQSDGAGNQELRRRVSPKSRPWLSFPVLSPPGAPGQSQRSS
jgi:hypothetical protein